MTWADALARANELAGAHGERYRVYGYQMDYGRRWRYFICPAGEPRITGLPQVRGIV